MGKGPDQQSRPEQVDEFQKRALDAPTGFVREFADFLRDNKKWWLTPIVLVLLAVGALIILAGTGAAPFIYTLF